MASNKAVRKTSTKNLLRPKAMAKKNPVVKKDKGISVSKPSVTKKKGKMAGGSKAITKKSSPKVTKPSVKKKPSAKAVPAPKKGVAKKTVSKKPKAEPKKSATQKHVPPPKKAPIQGSSAKKKVVANKTAFKKTKAAPKKSVVQTLPKLESQNSTTLRPVVPKKAALIVKTKAKPSQPKKVVLKGAKSSVSALQQVPKSQEPLLSPNERYNMGGLFACAIQRASDPDCSRLRAVLRHLDLSSQEKDNLIRLSEGLMIPKLFAESVPEEKVGLVLTDLVKFAMREGSYEKHWREEIQQVGLWLGIFPAQVQEIEQRIKR